MKDKTKNKYTSAHGGLWILIVAAVLLEAISCLMYFSSRVAIRQEAEKRAKTELRKADLEIEVHAVEMETAAKALALMVEKHLEYPDAAYASTMLAVNALRENTSMAVAFVPDYYPEKGYFYEVCSSRITEDSIFTRQIGSADHDYTQMEWYQNGFKYDSCWWCEPYLDNAGARTMVVSCSCPVHDRDGKVVAVVCVDMSLDFLQGLSDFLQVYANSYYSIQSGTGQNIVSAPDTVAGRKYNIYEREIAATGWHIEIIIPEEELFRDLNHIGRIVGVLMLLGLALLVFIMIRAAKSLIDNVNLSNQKERVEGELTIARDIQMAMLPTRFPPFPDCPGLNAFGSVTPAKEVGGDLFDFYLREGKLFFCVGDVSGKGVPASLVMAVTRSMFRSITSYLDSPAQVMEPMNASLTGEGNDQNMFVTFFIGVLDLSTGELRYCNAGHDAPIYVQKDDVPCTMLSVKPNLPLGVLAGFSFEEQQMRLHEGDTLFLYTDGLTEAENSAHEQFGEQRMMEAVSAQQSAVSCQDLVEAVTQRVKSFVGEAEQSDDLTLFAIKWIEKAEKRKDERVKDEQVNTETHFSLVMRNDIQQIPTLAEWIDSIGVPEELNMPINLALEEAVSNVMLYAYPETKSGRVLVECVKAPGELVFTISDSGIPFDPTQQAEPDITLSAEERSIGGLGIHLVRQIMNEVRYERKEEKNILTLVKKIG